jgi:starch phosphorylase
LYDILEQQVIPEFYDRDSDGISQAWLKRVRSSMAQLTPRFSSHRMVREYVERLYLPAAEALSKRRAHRGKLADAIEVWQTRLREGWRGLRFGHVHITKVDPSWHFDVQVYLGDLEPDHVQVELYADPVSETDHPTRIIMHQRDVIAGAVNGYVFRGECPSTRPADHYTPRVVPFHPEATVPMEAPLILWKR